MNFLHSELKLVSQDRVEVALDKRANVRLMDVTNLQKYKQGEMHKYYGGYATTSPVTLSAPGTGEFHLVIDLGGFAGDVRASVKVVKGA